MSDHRQDKSDRFKTNPAERGSPHGEHSRRGEQEIEEEFETQTGHPLGSQSSTTPSNQMPSDLPPNTDLQRDQHTRKGQAQSPRELNLNQPEKKREGHH